MTLGAALALGFALGMRHALDPDHVVAVSTIVARTRRLGAAWLLGAVWGLGHSLTIFAVGAAIIVARVRIPARLGLALESAVGVALVALGVWNLYGGPGAGVVVHAHTHTHDEHEHPHGHQQPATAHSHLHAHGAEDGWLKRSLAAAGPMQLLRSACVGLVHGLAGSAAVALLVLAAIPEPRAALIYLVIFGFGTLVGMLLISAAMEYSFVRLAAYFTPGQLWLSRATGLVSLLFGLWVLRENAGLFSAHPSWTPR
jgi:high-affinity nickel-transport protein